MRGAVDIFRTWHLARVTFRNCTVLEMGEKLNVVSGCGSWSGLTLNAANKADLTYSPRYLKWSEHMLIVGRALTFLLTANRQFFALITVIFKKCVRDTPYHLKFNSHLSIHGKWLNWHCGSHVMYSWRFTISSKAAQLSLRRFKTAFCFIDRKAPWFQIATLTYSSHTRIPKIAMKLGARLAAIFCAWVWRKVLGRRINLKRITSYNNFVHINSIVQLIVYCNKPALEPNWKKRNALSKYTYISRPQSGWNIGPSRFIILPVQPDFWGHSFEILQCVSPCKKYVCPLYRCKARSKTAKLSLRRFTASQAICNQKAISTANSFFTYWSVTNMMKWRGGTSRNETNMFGPFLSGLYNA